MSTPWREVRARLRRDRERLAAHLAAGGAPPMAIRLSPSYGCVALYRWSHYLHGRGHRLGARAIWHLNVLLTGADISPIASLGPGLLVVHPAGVVLVGRMGADCTVIGSGGGVGGGMGDRDIGAGPGLPVIGDRVTVGFGAAVLGPVTLGDDCEIGPRALVTRDVAPGAKVQSEGYRVRGAV